MAEYVYPAVFHRNDNGTYTIIYPDLPGCISEGKTLENALYMAQDALTQWLGYLTDEGETIPTASARKDIAIGDGEFVNLVRASVRDNKAVRRTVSVPRWLDEAAAAANLSLSRILQEALKERLDVQ